MIDLLSASNYLLTVSKVADKPSKNNEEAWPLFTCKWTSSTKASRAISTKTLFHSLA